VLSAIRTRCISSTPGRRSSIEYRTCWLKSHPTAPARAQLLCRLRLAQRARQISPRALNQPSAVHSTDPAVSGAQASRNYFHSRDTASTRYRRPATASHALGPPLFASGLRSHVDCEERPPKTVNRTDRAAMTYGRWAAPPCLQRSDQIEPLTTPHDLRPSGEKASTSHSSDIARIIDVLDRPSVESPSSVSRTRSPH